MVFAAMFRVWRRLIGLWHLLCGQPARRLPRATYSGWDDEDPDLTP